MYPVWKATRILLQYNQSDESIPGFEWIYAYNRIMLEVASQNIGKFIPLTIQRHESKRDYYKLIEPWPELWGSYESYKTSVFYVATHQCGKSIVDEYMQFMAACYQVGWNWMPFDFKEIRL